MLDVWRYNLGLSTEEPKFSIFNYAEKMNIGRFFGALW
jgi:hypothetical protein